MRNWNVRKTIVPREEMPEEQRWNLVNYVRTFAPRPRDREDENAQAARGK